MKTTAKVAAVAFVVLALVVALLKWGEEPAPVSPRPVSLASEPESAIPVLKAAVNLDGESRAAVEPVHVEPAHVEPPAQPVIETPLPEDRFWGRVVAAADGFPVAGARVRPLDKSLEPQVADEGGLFGLPVGNRLPRFGGSIDLKGLGSLEIEAPGFGPVRVAITEGHETSATALEIRLTRCASLTVTVRDASGAALTGARVKLSAKAYTLGKETALSLMGPDWSREGRTALDGSCRLLDLPPEVSLDLEIVAEGCPAHREPSFVLTPGQEAERAVQIGGGTLIRGLLLDPTGAAVAGQAIWLLHENEGGAATEGRAYFFDGDERKSVQRARTGDDGRFELHKVAAGTWWIGPAAPGRSTASLERRFLPLVTVLRIETGEVEREVVLQAEPGQTIQGLVLDPNDVPVTRTSLFAMSNEVRFMVDTSTDEQGAFTLGPVPPGSFQIRASPPQQFARPEPVTAQAGDTSVILRLSPGAALKLQAIDRASGERCAAEYRLVGATDGTVRVAPLGAGTGSRQMGGLQERPYDVIAVTEDGRIGVAHGAQATLDAEGQVTEIPVAPGAKLRLFYEGPQDYCQFRIFDGTACVTHDSLLSETSTIALVPAGRLRVEARLGPDSLQEQWVDTAPGREVEVTFRF